MNESVELTYPVYFALASGAVISDRQGRDDEDWGETLELHDLTKEQYEKYEDFWITPDGFKLLKDLSLKFRESILQFADQKNKRVLSEYLESANWSDFIRELADCSKGESSYFLENAVEQGLCWNTDTSEVDGLNEILENWFNSSYEESREILLTGLPLMSRTILD